MINSEYILTYSTISKFELDNLLEFYNYPDMTYLPRILDEITNRTKVVDEFEELFDNWKEDKNWITQFEDKYIGLSLENKLILNGMRITEGSIINKEIDKPSLGTLIDLCKVVNRAGLSEGARALSKHYLRDSFWPEPIGNNENKNKIALSIIELVINKHTWFNIFGHHKYEYIFEYRLPNGFGARWTSDRFIGLVDNIDGNTGKVFTT